MATEAASGPIGPEKSLPYSSAFFSSSEEYVDGLLDYIGANDLLTTLCGGVHILDFFTTTPDLYSRVLPLEWRSFFRQQPIMDILDLLMREDLSSIPSLQPGSQWRQGPSPPASLVEYISGVRKHLLDRSPQKASRSTAPTSGVHASKLARHVAVGMNVKKVHEVGLFASYVRTLTSSLSSSSGSQISHLLDFGSGQNYLGRALASQPYNLNIVAIESKGHNQDRAIEYDVMAKLRAKEVVMRNKKLFRAQLEGRDGGCTPLEEAEVARDQVARDQVARHQVARDEVDQDEAATNEMAGGDVQNGNASGEVASGELPNGKGAEDANSSPNTDPKAKVQISAEGEGTIQYVEHWIENGDLTNVTTQIVNPRSTTAQSSHLQLNADRGPTGFSEADIDLPSNLTSQDDKNLMVISLHSCGNLVHHGLRSLTANPSVRAVALIGCCYNKITERLTPATYKLPALRPAAHPRLARESTRGDPHGFPMSARLCARAAADSQTGAGIRMNITARMMAVQAPQNWGVRDSANFFTRHFYRALLQRVFLDRGVVGAPTPECVGGSPLGHSSGTPIIIGSLPKAAYVSFPAYTRAALAKLTADPDRGPLFGEKMHGVTDAQLAAYEQDFQERKKELSVIWSLMAFSAGVVESLIVVDRWLWLKEQPEVREAWVESVFDYAVSPRNLVVVGIRS